MSSLLFLCSNRMSNKTFASVSVQNWEKDSKNLHILKLIWFSFLQFKPSLPVPFTRQPPPHSPQWSSELWPLLFPKTSLCSGLSMLSIQELILWMMEKDGIIEQDVPRVWCPHLKILMSQWPNPFLTFLLQGMERHQYYHHWCSKEAHPTARKWWVQ